MKPIVEAEGGYRYVKPIETAIQGLSLLPGDIRLSEFEENLNGFWAEALQRKIKGYKGLTAMSALIDECTKRHRFDFVFYDTGPNIGPLNRIILLDCDWFIVPAACDLFSVRALKTLGHTLSEWISQWDTISDIAPDGIKLLSGEPKFLGYIPQRFRVYGRGMARVPAHYLSQIEKHVFSDIISVLRAIKADLAPIKLADSKLGEVKEFATLVPLAQAQGLPLSEVIGGDPTLKQQAKQAFAEIAKKLITSIKK